MPYSRKIKSALLFAQEELGRGELEHGLSSMLAKDFVPCLVLKVMVGNRSMLT